MARILQVVLGFLLGVPSIAQQNIVSFGGIPGVDSLAQATENGLALAAAIEAANSSSSAGLNRTVVIPEGSFWLLPAQQFSFVSNLVILVQGTIAAYTTNFSLHWPIDIFGNPISVLQFDQSSNLRINGGGVIDGNGYDW
jgi:hypothetical protein